MPDEPLNNEQVEPSSPLPLNTTGSEPSNMPSEAPESPKNVDIPVSLNNDNPQNEPNSTPSPSEAKPEEIPAEGEKTEEISPVLSEPAQTLETRTAQIPVNEPLASEPEVKPEPFKTEPETFSQPKISLARELLVKARNMIQFRKRKKLDRVMTLFLKKSKITNDEVKDFLHVSDATATRYLSQLEQEGKIKQNGKTGHAVSYSRI
ncbi:MAG: hypothetical protein WCP17_02745 [bacterium]